MKKLLTYVFAVTLLMTATIPCIAADSPWNGTWKMNPAKTKIDGGTFTSTSRADGWYHYSNGTVEYDYTCDGKPHAAYLDRTVTCTGDVVAGFDFITTANGKLVQKSRHILSSGGSTSVNIYTDIHPDGTTESTTLTCKRIGPGTGMAGKWQTVREESSQSDICVISVSGGVWHEQHPAENAKVDGKLDGTDSLWTGPNVPEGTFASFKLEGPNKVRVVHKYKDKVVGQSIQVLSADGKTFSDETWPPGKVTEKRVHIYEKQ